jgi:hypothetical protein
MASTVSERPPATEHKKLERMLQKSVRAAKLLHKQTGHPIVVWKDGKVVEIPPEEIVIDDEG